MSKSDALDIKRALRSGQTPAQVAARLQKPYMVVYRIAIGETWKGSKKTGERISPARQLVLTAELRYRIWSAKRSTGASNAKLAKALRLSESMVARAVQDGRALTAYRAQRLMLTSGDLSMAMERYSLTMEEAEAMVTWASEHELPKHLQAEFAAEE